MPTVQSNGCPIHYEVEGSADKPVLMFCNSLGTTLHMWDGQMAEVLKHFTAIEYAVTMSMVTINADAWRALDPESQTAVLAAAAATEARQWEVMKTRVAANYAQMRAAGVGISTDLSPEYRRALREAGQVAVDDWLQKTGPAGAQIIERYRKRLVRSSADQSSALGAKLGVPTQPLSDTSTVTPSGPVYFTSTLP